MLSELGHTRFLNIGLRGITLASKFLLVVFFAKFLDPRDLGLYGLFIATIGYGIYIIGFEFYTFSMRELISAKREERSQIIKNQFSFYLSAYLLCSPLLVLFFYYGGLPWEYFWWFLIILVLEHVAQELNRILISLSDQLYAGVILFIRSGLWGIVVISVQWCVPELRNLNFVFLMWLMSCLFACVLAIKRIANQCDSFSGLKIDIAWIVLGLKVAFPMLLASLATRGIFTFDKYLVEGVGGLELLGSYVFFIGMVTAVISFIDAGVVDFAYPKLVSASWLADKGEFKKEMALLMRNVILLGSVLILVCGVVSYFLVQYINKPVYTNNIYILYWLLAAIAINTLSLIPHLGLYALGRNNPIVFSQVFGLLVFLVVSHYLNKSYGLVSILWAMCSAWLSILLRKLTAYRAAALKFNH